MRLTVFTLALLGLAACTDMAPSGDLVPYSQVMAETQDRPYECTAYDPATHSCSTIATNQRAGDGWISEGAALISDAPRVAFQGRVAVAEVQGRACADMTTLEIGFDGLADPFAEAFMRAALAEEIQRSGPVLCVSYHRNGDGYTAVTRTPSGARVASAPDEQVTFHADRPNLRF